GDFGKLGARPAELPQVVRGQERCGGIAGTTAEAGQGRNAFGKRESDAAIDAGTLAKQLDGAIGKVLFSGRKLAEFAAGGCRRSPMAIERDAIGIYGRSSERIEQVDGDHERFDLMKPVGTARE